MYCVNKYILVYSVCLVRQKHTFHTFRIWGAQSGWWDTAPNFPTRLQLAESILCDASRHSARVRYAITISCRPPIPWLHRYEAWGQSVHC